MRQGLHAKRMSSGVANEFRDIPRDKKKHEKSRRQQLEDMLLNKEFYAVTSENFNDPFDAQEGHPETALDTA
jgi:hypothetical protein